MSTDGPEMDDGLYEALMAQMPSDDIYESMGRYVVHRMESYRDTFGAATRLLNAWMELADDLADVLARVTVGWENIIGHDLSKHPDVQRVMARYRQQKGRP